jgi:hypothetical protein
VPTSDQQFIQTTPTKRLHPLDTGFAFELILRFSEAAARKFAVCVTNTPSNLRRAWYFGEA